MIFFRCVSLFLLKRKSHYIYSLLITFFTKNLLGGIFASLFLFGCGTNRTIPYPAIDQQFPSFQRTLIITVPLPVYGWIPFPSKEKEKPHPVIRIYIEGDGKAWVRRGRPALDPTPVNRLTHHLMLNDLSANTAVDIAYLARPCQYVQTSACKTTTWTFDRYNQEIVDVMNMAVDKIKTQGGYKKIELVGYSGGGTIALLLAALREDVISVRTVAGNLDPAFTNGLHGVSKIPTALNPGLFKQELALIPQIHFFGTEDNIITHKVSAHYQQSIGSSNCILIKPVTASHQSGWAEQWTELLQIIPTCAAQ